MERALGFNDVYLPESKQTPQPWLLLTTIYSTTVRVVRLLPSFFNLAFHKGIYTSLGPMLYVIRHPCLPARTCTPSLNRIDDDTVASQRSCYLPASPQSATAERCTGRGATSTKPMQLCYKQISFFSLEYVTQST